MPKLKTNAGGRELVESADTCADIRLMIRRSGGTDEAMSPDLILTIHNDTDAVLTPAILVERSENVGWYYNDGQ